MSQRLGIQIVAGIVLLAALVWGVNWGLERLVVPEVSSTAPAEPSPAPTAHITATLFYASSDGRGLVPVRREIPLADGIVAQARQILTAQLRPPPEPYVSVVPPGTTLRAFYVTERGDAFVDLSAEVSQGHPGGSLTELLTVYALVNIVTANLSSVQRVQLLVDGKEVDTIAGHVDVRRPLRADTSLVGEQGPR